MKAKDDNKQDAVAEAPVTMTRQELDKQIAHLQWVISRDEDFVEENHAKLETLYGLRDKMDELEADNG